MIAFVKDPSGYMWELLQRGDTPEPLCQVSSYSQNSAPRGRENAPFPVPRSCSGWGISLRASSTTKVPLACSWFANGMSRITSESADGRAELPELSSSVHATGILSDLWAMALRTAMLFVN